MKHANRCARCRASDNRDVPATDVIAWRSPLMRAPAFWHLCESHADEEEAYFTAKAAQGYTYQRRKVGEPFGPAPARHLP